MMGCVCSKDGGYVGGNSVVFTGQLVWLGC